MFEVKCQKMKNFIIYICALFLVVSFISCKSYKTKAKYITNQIYTTDSHALYLHRTFNAIGTKLLIEKIIKDRINTNVSNKDTSEIVFSYHSFAPWVSAYCITKSDTIEYHLDFDEDSLKTKKVLLINKGLKIKRYCLIKNYEISKEMKIYVSEKMKKIYASQITPSTYFQLDGSEIKLIVKLWGNKKNDYQHYSLIKIKQKYNPSKRKIVFLN